jgi:hypothetical protein
METFRCSVRYLGEDAGAGEDEVAAALAAIAEMIAGDEDTTAAKESVWAAAGRREGMGLPSGWWSAESGWRR